MANEIVQGLLGNLLQPQQQGPSPADIMAAINSQNPMASAMALTMPQQAQVFGQGARGLLGSMGIGKGSMNAEQAMMEAMGQVDMTTSAGIQKAAQSALATGNRPLALQLTLQAQQLAKEEADLMKTTATQQLQAATGTAYLTDLISSIDNPKARTELAALMAPTSSRALSVEAMIEQSNEILDRHKVEAPSLKADLQNFIDGSGNVQMYRVNEEGMVDTTGRNTFVDPSTLGLTLAGTQSLGVDGAGVGGSTSLGVPDTAFDSQRAARRVLSVAFNPNLEALVGPSEGRRLAPTFMLAPDAAKVRRDIEISQTEGILPIMRALAPVTEEDVVLVKSTQPGFEDPQEVWIQRTLEEQLPAVRNIMYNRLSEKKQPIYPAQSFMMESVGEVFNALATTPQVFEKYGAERAIQEAYSLLPSASSIKPSEVPEGEVLFTTGDGKVVNETIVRNFMAYQNLTADEVTELLGLEVFGGK